MTPAFAQFNLAHGNLMDIEVTGDRALRSWIGSDGLYINRRQLCHLVALAALIIGVAHTFSGVLLARLPADMLWIDAAAYTAAVGSIVFGWCFAVRAPADDAMHFLDGVFPTHLRIATLIDRKRPEEAFVADIGESLIESGFGVHATVYKGL